LDARATPGWGRFGAILNPTVVFTENRAFELAPVLVPGMPEYGYPWRRIDTPQRFGPDSYWAVDPGQSEVRVDFGGAAVGLSTANLWWGPGVRNAILMSNHAPGFIHAFVGTRRPVETRVGRFEGRWIWGRLAQSDWFDPSVGNQNRYVTGLVVAYSPAFLDGLSLGLARVIYALVPTDGAGLDDYLAGFMNFRKTVVPSPANPLGHDEYDQLFSLFGRWVQKESGFEVYGEWSRNDAVDRPSGLFLEPEHSQGYTVGFQKADRVGGGRIVVLMGELTHLERSPTFQVRDSPPYYAHDIVTQGYTQRGQIIGAGIGTGGNSQQIGADLYDHWGRAGVYLERQVHDNDAYYAWAAANAAESCCHNVSVHLGGHTLFFLDQLDLGAGFIVTREYNRYFFGLDLWNLNLSASARWRPN
jgi:hypothetical protein